MKYHKIAVGIVEHKGKILFIKRVKEPFKDTLILPGGKLDKGETFEDALEREILEEIGLKIKQKKFVGQYDELVYNSGVATHKHEIMIYFVAPTSFNYKDSEEGKVYAIDMQQIPAKKKEINPSDYRMLERVLFENQKGFKTKISVEKTNGGYNILSEEDVTALQCNK